MSKILSLILLILPFTVIAQVNISGRVISHDNNGPIINASVFLNGASIGDATGKDGTYTLRNIPAGKFELIVSVVGYETFSETIIVASANIKHPDIFLYQKTTQLAEVKIKAQDNDEWKQNYELFRNEFLGSSDFAADCKITNPELLDISYDKGTKVLSAKSIDFLIIENKALGYRIKYLLSNFNLNSYDQFARQFYYEGSIFFEEMKGSTAEMETWNARRLEIYRNSLPHFLQALANDKLNEEGFKVYRYLLNPARPNDSLIYSKISLFTALKDDKKYRDSLKEWSKILHLPRLLATQEAQLVNSDELLSKNVKRGLFLLSSKNDALYVVYTKTHQYNPASLAHLHDQNNTSSTLMFFKKPIVYFDKSGQILNAGSLAFNGVWANRRLSELLPVNFLPPAEGPPADSTQVKNISNALNDFYRGREIEKAYLHTDKPYYAAGDTIYFKAYVTNAQFERAKADAMLNVELIDGDKKIVSSLKLKLLNGGAAGDFALADTIKNGRYQLRAYTAKMIDACTGYFYQHDFDIVNTPANQAGEVKNKHTDKKLAGLTSITKTNNAKLSVQFFPEGGNLINGLSSNIAFKAIGSNGLGIDVKGIVSDDNGKEIIHFSSTHLGMGQFKLKPEAGRKYKALIPLTDSTLVFDLPKADDTGFALSISRTKSDNLQITINAGAQNRQAQVNLLAQSGGRICKTIIANLVKNSFETVILKSDLPQGITQFTLFSASGEPMNERLVFNRDSSLDNLKLDNGNNITHTRQKIKINLSTKDRDNEPMRGDFSLTVTDQIKVPADEDNESSILSNMLLTSDIKGYIEKPGYYFKADNEQIRADLDVLMLTQGYHRFEWKNVLKHNITAPLNIEATLSTISGTIRNLNGKPVPFSKIAVFSVKPFLSFDTLADKDGRFIFRDLPIKDSIRYIVQASDKQLRKRTTIELDTMATPEITGIKLFPQADSISKNQHLAYFNYSKVFQGQQIKQGWGKKSIILSEVVIKEKKAQKYLKYSSNLNGPGKANDVITFDQLPLGCPILLNCIKGRLHGIEFMRGTPYHGGLYGKMETALFIDGVEMIGRSNTVKYTSATTKEEFINMLGVNDIASIEIITDASLCAVYGVEGGGGVIVITTKHFGDYDVPGDEKKRSFAAYAPMSYYKARTFYAPQYDVAKPLNNYQDLRTTIYWNPAVKTDEKGNTEITYYNADNKGTYRLVLEGIDENGHLVRKVSTYRVE